MRVLGLLVAVVLVVVVDVVSRHCLDAKVKHHVAELLFRELVAKLLGRRTSLFFNLRFNHQSQASMFRKSYQHGPLTT